MLFTDNAGVVHRIVAGSLRNTGSGWYVMSSSVYAPTDLAIGTVTSTSIQVTYPASAQVVTFLVGPDDTFAGLHTVAFGASVGLSSASIRGRLDGGAFNPLTWSHSSANLWVYGLFRA
jgi:hypothetical protein